MGHSRGTVTALAAAGGSNTWGIEPESDIKALMGMAIGAPAITAGANLAKVTIPAVLVAGGKDTNPNDALTVSQNAFNAISSADKQFVVIPNATHRTFDSTYCDQLHSAGVFAQNGGANGQDPGRAILDWHTVRLIGTSFPGGSSGMAHEYCSEDTFRNPDIAGLMTSFNGLRFTDLEDVHLRHGTEADHGSGDRRGQAANGRSGRRLFRRQARTRWRRRAGRHGQLSRDRQRRPGRRRPRRHRRRLRPHPARHHPANDLRPRADYRRMRPALSAQPSPTP